MPLSRGLLAVENRFYRVMSGAANCNLAHGVHIAADMLMGRGHFEGVDDQLQYPPQGHQQIAITGTRAW
jgi:hypothetical protein